MENYLNLKNQLELALVRLDTLNEQKIILNSFLYPKTSKISDMPKGKGCVGYDPFTNYTFHLVNIDKQITVVKQEINILEKNIKKMDEILRNMKGPTYQIFVYRFLDGLRVKDIARKTNYTTRRIYQILDKIQSKLAN